MQRIGHACCFVAFGEECRFVLAAIHLSGMEAEDKKGGFFLERRVTSTHPWLSLHSYFDYQEPRYVVRGGWPPSQEMSRGRELWEVLCDQARQDRRSR